MTLQDYSQGSIQYSYDARSDMGMVRSNNEDSLLVVPETGLFGVCDGLGGHAAGEVASSIASKTVQEMVEQNEGVPEETLRKSIAEANRRILAEQADNPNQRGMGTTVSSMWLIPGSPGLAWVGHVGDSRIYLLRDSQLKQVTDDHSPLFRLYKQGALTKEQMQVHPQKHLLERSLGILPIVEVDAFTVGLNAGDVFLICSDGLHDNVTDSEIQSLLQQESLTDAVEGLVKAANEKGGSDNITVVVVRILQV